MFKKMFELNDWTTRLYARAQSAKVMVRNKVMGKLQNERGGVSLEWLALGILVVALLGAVAMYFQNTEKGAGLAGQINKFFEDMITKLTSGNNSNP